MRYLLSNLPLNLGEEALDLAKPLAHALGGASVDYRAVTLERRSLDARHKGAIRFLAAISFESDRCLTWARLPGGLKLDLRRPWRPTRWRSHRAAPGGDRGQRPRRHLLRPASAGLRHGAHRAGARPAMGERVKAIAGLWKDGVLDPEANAQFGEGGAGTFSDGKLTTRIGHPATRYVLEAFVRFGANPRILYLAKPHVGTDVIRRCSVLIRKEAEARGAQYRFQARLEDVRFDATGRVWRRRAGQWRGDPLRGPGAGAGPQRPGHLRDAAPPRRGHAPETLRHGRAGGASPGPHRPLPVRAQRRAIPRCPPRTTSWSATSA
jgi:hypothetical protein